MKSFDKGSKPSRGPILKWCWSFTTYYKSGPQVDDIIMASTPTGDPRLNSDDEGDAKSSAGMSSAVTVYSESVLSNKEKLFEKAFQEFKSLFSAP